MTDIAKLCDDLRLWADAADEGDRISYAYANGAPCPDVVSQMGADIRKAIGLLEQAVRENERLREALEPVKRGASEADYYCPDDVAEDHVVFISMTIGELRAARSALSPEPPLGAPGAPCDWDIDYSGDHK